MHPRRTQRPVTVFEISSLVMQTSMVARWPSLRFGFRKPLLYPLSYGGSGRTVSPLRALRPRVGRERPAVGSMPLTRESPRLTGLYARPTAVTPAG